MRTGERTAQYKVPRKPREHSPRGWLSSYVCKSLFKWKNSQILRRPQDDIDFCGSFANAPCGCHPEASEGPCISSWAFWEFITGQTTLNIRVEYKVPRRPRDDKDGVRLQTTPKLDVILRPPKDLAVLSCVMPPPLCLSSRMFVIPTPPRDLVFMAPMYNGIEFYQRYYGWFLNLQHA